MGLRMPCSEVLALQRSCRNASPPATLPDHAEAPVYANRRQAHGYRGSHLTKLDMLLAGLQVSGLMNPGKLVVGASLRRVNIEANWHILAIHFASPLPIHQRLLLCVQYHITTAVFSVGNCFLGVRD